ncbi:MAG: ribosome recycling factor [Deltaproteobacteria bacterium]|nr:ribosome recycling factor [Deltaproteobacteria bacterium]
MNVNDIINKNKQDCDASLQAFRKELQRVKTGRASAGLVEGLIVDYYGSKTPLSRMAQISTPEPRLISIQVYDAGAASAVEKAIQMANLGLNPSRDGNTIRVNIPALTQETRAQIVKALHKMAEDIKVSVRNHRRDSNEDIKKLEKDSIATKDEAKKALDKVQKQTDSYIEEIDKLLKAKEAEAMEV